MVNSLTVTFGKTLAPALEKLRGDAPDRFQIDLNAFSKGEMDVVYDRLTTEMKKGVTYEETDLTNFALLFGAKSLQSDFHDKEQEKIKDIRDYVMLGIARDRVGGGQHTSYHVTAFFHECAHIMGYKWNDLPEHDLMLNAEKIKIYNQYTRNTYNTVVEQNEKIKALMPKDKPVEKPWLQSKKAVDKQIENMRYFADKQLDFFSIPQPCYQSLTIQEMLDYALYVVVEGDVETYLRDEASSIQKFRDMLENGESFNPVELRAAWWTEEEKRRANTPKNPNMFGQPHMDRSKEYREYKLAF